MNVATNNTYVNKDGKKQTDCVWHRVVLWNATAENAVKYLSKGRQVYVEGRLQNRQWEDANGVKRFTTEVVAQRVDFLGGSSKVSDNSELVQKEEGQNSEEAVQQLYNEDVVF